MNVSVVLVLALSAMRLAAGPCLAAVATQRRGSRALPSLVAWLSGSPGIDCHAYRESFGEASVTPPPVTFNHARIPSIAHKAIDRHIFPVLGLVIRQIRSETFAEEREIFG